ncbi:MAG TPA: hypothetical protein VJH05_02285 [Candidatus Paceibacterota bacterium]
MSLFFLTVMFIVNFGCMMIGIIELFGQWMLFSKFFNSFFYVMGSVGVALNITILMRQKN